MNLHIDWRDSIVFHGAWSLRVERERFGVLLALALLHVVLLHAPPFYPFLIDGRGFDALFSSMLHASTAIHEARADTEISPIPLEGKLTGWQSHLSGGCELQ